MRSKYLGTFSLVTISLILIISICFSAYHLVFPAECKNYDSMWSGGQVYTELEIKIPYNIPQKVRNGEKVTVQGIIRTTSNRPIAGVNIKMSSDFGWKSIVTANKKGEFIVDITAPNEPRTYTIIAVFEETDDFHGSSASMSFWAGPLGILDEFEIAGTMLFSYWWPLIAVIILLIPFIYIGKAGRIPKKSESSISKSMKSKGIEYCYHCGKAIAVGSKFCKKCGRSQ